jgi:hypothetical protein
MACLCDSPLIGRANPGSDRRSVEPETVWMVDGRREPTVRKGSGPISSQRARCEQERTSVRDGFNGDHADITLEDAFRR